MLTPTAHCPLPYLQSRKRIHRQISNFFTRFKKRTGFEELRKRIKVQPILHSAMQSTVCVCLSLTYTQRILLLDKSQEELEDDDDESAEYLDPTEARQVELSADEKAKKLAECAKLLARIADAQVAL